jgi:hypothetical protein
VLWKLAAPCYGVGCRRRRRHNDDGLNENAGQKDYNWGNMDDG